MKIREVVIDNSKGWGAVPYNADVDYFGIRVLMKPSTFLSLALKLTEPINRELAQHISQGGSIGSPFLELQFPVEWEDGDFKEYAKVVGHEGRNRMHTLLKLEGDNPVEVHLFPRGGFNRRRYITDSMIDKLNQGAYAERSTTLVKGPLFSI